jgi:hypothetical protein
LRKRGDLRLNRSHEDGRIIGVEGGPESSTSSGKAAKEANVSSYLKNALEWVYGNIEEKRRKWVSLP